ncbi:MAG: carbohydrate ABC transporter permease [bacterium]|nr:carbohydrate ABC transporter permease [bacterium]
MLFLILLGTMMIPYQVTIIPLFILFRKMGWVNTFLPLTVPAFFATSAFHVFLLKQFYNTIPKELSDSANIDGCSEFRVWWNIILPLAKPALVSVGIFNFIGHWNDFLGPLIYLQDNNKYTLAIGLYSFRNEFGTDY